MPQSQAADVAVHGIRERIDAECRIVFIQPAKDDRAKIAFVHSAVADQFDCRLAKLIAGEFGVHPVDFGGIEETLHMFGQTKNRRPLSGLITRGCLQKRSNRNE